jgi:hypothetical protein
LKNTVFIRKAALAVPRCYGDINHLSFRPYRGKRLDEGVEKAGTSSAPFSDKERTIARIFSKVVNGRSYPAI